MTSRSAQRDNESLDETRWLTDAENRAWMAVLAVGSGLFNALSADLKKLDGGLTLEDYEVLHHLSVTEDRSLRVGSLADRMLSSRTRLSQRLDRMTDRGLVVRKKCQDDGRAIDVCLTDDGYELLVQMAPVHLNSVRRIVFDHLDNNDVDAIGDSLEKVANHLRGLRR